MTFVISSILPFPPISWWCYTLGADKVYWDPCEHFEKMSNRNRYSVSSANGHLKLSIPLVGGRDQRSAMGDIVTSNAQDWQKQHWRTLVSAYNRSPYFEFYAPSLEILFRTKMDRLIDFNLSSIGWLKKELKLDFIEETVLTYERGYPDALFDLRKGPLKGMIKDSFPVYNQVFSERTGFIPDLSLLDLLFAEGPYSVQWLLHNKEIITMGV